MPGTRRPDRPPHATPQGGARGQHGDQKPEGTDTKDTCAICHTGRLDGYTKLIRMPLCPDCLEAYRERNRTSVELIRKSNEALYRHLHLSYSPDAAARLQELAEILLKFKQEETGK